MEAVNAVIFDLGGVILNIDYRATEKALRQLIGPRTEEYYQQSRQTALFDDLETGHIEPEEFRRSICLLAGRTLPNEAIDQAWNAMLGDLPLARMDFVKRVAARHRVFLLSNTNVIHKTAFEQIADQALQGPAFDDYFEAAYYSHQMGLRKPNPDIYRYVTSRHGLDPAATLFIDDNLANVEAARQAGLQSFHLQGELLTAPLNFLI